MAQSPSWFTPPRGLPSPVPSSASSSRALSSLPHPRTNALRPGSSKEEMVRRFVDERLTYVSRRYVKKFISPSPGDTVVGYKSFIDVCKDLDGAVDVLWKSGTPSLQVPFLLKLASDFTQYVVSFPPSPKASFDLLRKLDHCFSSLLAGQDAETNEPLPGFEKGLRAGMTITDMIRCRSSVEQTRVLMVKVMSAGEVEDDDEEGEEEDSDDDDDDGHAWDIDEDKLHLDVARIYENTIVQLGKRLGDPLDNDMDSDI